MNKDKIIYEFIQETWDKLFIRLNEGECNISYVNFSHEVDEDFDPTGVGSNKVSIPFWLIPKLKEGIDKAYNEWKKNEWDGEMEE